MGHTRHKKLNLNYNPKRTNGKKGYKYKKSWGAGKMSLSKHRKMICGDNKNHADSIARTREYNIEEERYQKMIKKRKFMCESIMELFNSRRKFY